jgi:hypothetical protein
MNSIKWCLPIVRKNVDIKVNKFQNEFIKSSFLAKYERKLVRISALYTVPIPKIISAKNARAWVSMDFI